MSQHRTSDNQIKVRDFLRSNEVRVGERLPGERELASRLGLGRAALRSVLESLEAEGVLLRQPQSGTYLVSMPAPAVQNVRVFVIGTFQGGGGPDSTWLYRIISAFERVAIPAGIQPIIKDQSPYISDPCSIKNLVHEAMDSGAHAVVLLNPTGPQDKIGCALWMLGDRNIHPIVVTSHDYSCVASQVYFDSGWGMYVGTRHLIANGHTRIAFAGGSSDNEWITERLTGYRNALDAVGIETNKEWEWLIDPCEPVRPDLCGLEIVKRWQSISPEQRPTAIVAANDSIGVSIFNHARNAGLCIPEDLSLVGFDNLPEAMLAGLTTIERPTEALGEAVAKVTLERLAGGNDAPAVTLRLKPVLIPRTSVAKLGPRI